VNWRHQIAGVIRQIQQCILPACLEIKTVIFKNSFDKVFPYFYPTPESLAFFKLRKTLTNEFIAKKKKFFSLKKV